MPWMGSAQQGPWAVASWKAYVMVEAKVCADIAFSEEGAVVSGVGDSWSLGVLVGKTSGDRGELTLCRRCRLLLHQPECWGLFGVGRRR